MEETTINNPQLPPNPTKFYTHFLYKAILVSIFLLILPLFPSQAPDFINNKTINTTSWEFLQLVFVGIAVSYGLFSKRNDETRKEEGPFKPDNKPDNVQSYVARLLQVSSVFDDDSDNPSASGSHDKVQTWNSQYYRGEPIVVVAKDSDDAATIEKPLLLPVRSLKTGVSESQVMDSESNSVSRSNWRRVSRNLRRLSSEETEENVVLRSPIPWRSRSGRMEVKEDFYQTPSVHNSAEINPTESPPFRHQSSKSSRPGLNPSSENRIHPSSPTLSFEIQSIEEGGRRKTTQKSAFSQIPPPPPPPPPPHRLVNVNQFYNGTHMYATGKELKRNMRSLPDDTQNRGRRSSEFAIRSRSDVSSAGRSFRTRKDSELDEYLSHDSEIERFIERKGSQRKKFMDEDIEYSKDEKKELIESLDDDEEEEVGSMRNEDMVGSDNGPDVDKKADEFIAKFREQIRLQRIASIRKSTTQNGTK